MKFLKEAAKEFCFEAEPVEYKRCDDGHINDTFFVDCGCKKAQYILQRVNTSIFTKPDELMANILGVCDFIREKIKLEGGDVERCVRTVVPTKSGNYYYIDSEGGYWRAYLSIDNVMSHNSADSPELFYKAARSFGHFFMQLSDYPAKTLYETIPDFHNTPKRLNDLKTAVKNDSAHRGNTVKKEIDFALERENKCSFIVDGLRDGRFKLCVTHNDTKLNNILMDSKTGEGVCIIDLDTVMPGSVLYDFGDAIRFGASSAAEDETDLDRVFVDLEYFETFVKGFLEELRPSLTDDEVLGLPMGAYLMTFETAIRFLADYLNGDVYFRIHYPEHNIDRARNQLKLVADMEQKMPELEAIVRKYL